MLTVSWELALGADGYAENTVKAYQNAVRSLGGWLAERHPEVGPVELERRHVLQVADVDLRDRIVFVAGKASRRSGPRHRAVPLVVKAARALDRYLRERRRHSYADTPRLWLGSRGRPTLDVVGRPHLIGSCPKKARCEATFPQEGRHRCSSNQVVSRSRVWVGILELWPAS